MSLVSTEWLQKNLNNVKIIDSSWHLPNTKRNGYKEYLKNQKSINKRIVQMVQNRMLDSIIELN